MGITIDQILRMPVMHEARLIAGGEAARTNIVEAIAILESADSIRWLQRNNLIISNAQFLKLYPKLHTTIVDSLAQRGAAGIALKLNRHVRELPQEMIDAADRLQFPIIGLPHQITSSQIINAVTYEIYSRDAYDPKLSYAENFLRELLVSNLDKNSMRNRALTLGWNLGTRMCAAVLEADGDLDEGFAQMVFDCGFTYLLRLENGHVAVAVAQEGEHPQISEQALVDDLKERNPLRSIFVGVGRTSKELIGLADSYREARLAMYMGMSNNPARPLTRFSQMGVYTVLLDKRNEGALEKLFDDTIGVLERYDKRTKNDCLHTAAVYLDKDQSIERTAKHLYVHYNTVRYRLAKVHELLGSGLSQDEALLNLQMALRIKKCMQLMGDAVQYA